MTYYGICPGASVPSVSALHISTLPTVHRQARYQMLEYVSDHGTRRFDTRRNLERLLARLHAVAPDAWVLLVGLHRQFVGGGRSPGRVSHPACATHLRRRVSHPPRACPPSTRSRNALARVRRWIGCSRQRLFQPSARKGRPRWRVAVEGLWAVVGERARQRCSEVRLAVPWPGLLRSFRSTKYLRGPSVWCWVVWIPRRCACKACTFSARCCGIGIAGSANGPMPAKDSSSDV